MAGLVDSDTLDMLRAKGVTKATFHADGTIASLEFGPEVASVDATAQHQTQAPEPRAARATGRLVPRDVDADRS